jgi:hypothetical protein
LLGSTECKSRGAAADDGPEDLRVMNEILREALEAPDADADADADEI